MHVPTGHPVYEFGGFTVDVGGRRLLAHDGRVVRLNPRAFDTLLCLIENRGELLSKTMLMKAVWPDHIVEENNLNQAIMSLRKALGDTRNDPRFILTEAGRGYRFVAEVTSNVDAITSGDLPARRSRQSLRNAIALVFALLAMASLVTLIYLTRESPLPAGPEPAAADYSIIPRSVAVLPFENLSPKAEDAYFAAGIHDEIINRLAGIRELNVIARTSVMQYAETDSPITEIARELRVESVLEGTVRYADEQVRITTQLVDGTNGAKLWSGAYSRDLKDVFAIQGEIANAIAISLEARLSPEERTRLEKPPTDSPAAYALFLQATNSFNDLNIAESLSYLDRGIEIDPDFALAQAFSAYVATWQLVNTTAAMPNDSLTLWRSEQRAITATSRALALDEDLAMAWVAQAALDQLTWRWREAKSAYERAYTLSPSDINLVREYAQFTAILGDGDEAIRLGRLQVELNPHDLASYMFLAGAASFSGRPDVALAAMERANRLAPGNVMVIAVKGYSLLQQGELGAALQYLETADVLITEDSGLHLPALTYAYGRYGYAEKAQSAFERYRIWAETYRAGAGDWALAYLGLRDGDTAFEWLGRAVDSAENHRPEPGFWALVLIMTDLHDDPMLKEPRFRGLRDRLRTLARVTQ